MNESPAGTPVPLPTKQYDLSPLLMAVTDETIKAYTGGGFQGITFTPKRIGTLTVTFAAIVVIGGPVVISLLASNTVAGYIIAAIVVIASIFLGIRWLQKMSRQTAERAIRIGTFAQVNGFQYVSTADAIPNEPGMIFNIGDERSYNDIITSGDNANGFMFGNFRYYTGAGKNRMLIETGFLRITLDRRLPQIVLDGKRNNWHPFGMNVTNLPIGFDKHQAVSLEGDFDKYFQLYAPQGYERDALYVFTPDLMALFIDYLAVNDAELVDNMLYIYLPHLDLTNTKTVSQLLTIVDTVGKKVLRQTEHYQDDRALVSQGQTVADGGKRLKRRVSAFSIVIGIAVVILNLGPIIQIFQNFFMNIFGGSH